MTDSMQTFERVLVAAETITTQIEQAVAPASIWAEAVRDFLRAPEHRTRSEIDEYVEALVSPALTKPNGTPLAGAGFVARPGLLSDAEWHLAWWLRPDSTASAPRRLEAVENPSALDFRDYTLLEWWQQPELTGQRHLTGPYVDYVCTDVYTLTLTLPLHDGDDMLGVVGVDLAVEDIEERLIPALDATSETVVLTNRHGRVVTSSRGQLSPGTILAEPEFASTVPCGATQLLLHTLRD